MTNWVARFGRSLLVTAITVSVVALSALVLAQQRGRGPARTISPAAIGEAKQTIDKAAVARGLILTDAAKEALAKEAVREQATDPAPDRNAVTGVLSDEKVTKLLAPLGNDPTTRLTDQDVRTRVANDKLKQIETTIPSDVETHVAAKRQGLPPDVQSKIVEDLTRQSESLSKSGLPVDAIRVRNAATLRALDQALGATPITPQTYQQAMLEIFDKQVDLSITTTPPGAMVAANGASIGTSNIAAKPFKPGPYVFSFQLTGYRPAEREFYVTPGVDSDSVDEPLDAEPSGGGVKTPESGASSPGVAKVPTETNGTFPWTYVVLVGIIAVLAVALVMRRK
jgi:PEGA domain-containing protein